MEVDMNELKEIARRLKQVREKLGLRQNQLANELGISGGTMSEVEAANAKPNFDLLYNLSKKYGVNINYVLHGQGNMFSSDQLNNDFGIMKEERTPFIKKFIRYFNSSEIVRFYVLASFKEILIKNKKLIEVEINQDKNKNINTTDDYE